MKAPQAPTWLNKVAKTYWGKLVKEVEPLTAARQIQLALLCDGLSTIRQATEILEKEVSGHWVLVKQKALDQVNKSYRLLGLNKDKPEASTIDELTDFFTTEE